MRLANKLAVITAAASGMGRAGVELFLKEGAKVVAVDVNADALNSLAADMKKLGHEITTIQADLSKPEQMKSSINDAAAALGGIDILWA
ncbi:MAG: SDR family NAD(P)-dependent oxidoreductase, partial [Tardiphaga sp.]